MKTIPLILALMTLGAATSASAASAAPSCSYNAEYAEAQGLSRLPTGQFYLLVVRGPGLVAEYILHEEDAGKRLYFKGTPTEAELYVVQNHGGPNHVAFQKSKVVAVCS